MATAMTLYLGNKLARWLAGNDMPTAPAGCYVGLFNGDPKTTGVEVTTDVDATGRKVISFDAVADDGEDNIVVNDADVDFGLSDSDVDVSHAQVYDAISGNPLFSGALTGGPFSIATGAAVKFPAGSLVFTFGSGTPSAS